MAMKIEDLENLTKLTDEEASNINGGTTVIDLPPPPYPIPQNGSTTSLGYYDPETGRWFLSQEGATYQQR